MTTAENTVTALPSEVKLTLTPRQTENFWKKVSKAPRPKGCWEWTAAKSKKGYGFFGFGLRTYHAHRVAYRLCVADITSEVQVLHTCDNPPCCNPAHLFPGTNQDNVDDKMAKGRHNPGRGENNGGGGKLTWPDVRAIRAMRATEGMSQQAIADRFGVSQCLVGLILRNKLWREDEHQ